MEPPLLPTTTDEIAEALAYGLRYDGRKRVHTGDEFMARLTADCLEAYLDRCGFVIMKKPAADGHAKMASGG